MCVQKDFDFYYKPEKNICNELILFSLTLLRQTETLCFTLKTEPMYRIFWLLLDISNMKSSKHSETFSKKNMGLMMKPAQKLIINCQYVNLSIVSYWQLEYLTDKNQIHLKLRLEQSHLAYPSDWYSVNYDSNSDSTAVLMTVRQLMNL